MHYINIKHFHFHFFYAKKGFWKGGGFNGACVLGKHPPPSPLNNKMQQYNLVLDLLLDLVLLNARVETNFLNFIIWIVL